MPRFSIAISLVLSNDLIINAKAALSAGLQGGALRLKLYKVTHKSLPPQNPSSLIAFIYQCSYNSRIIN